MSEVVTAEGATARPQETKERNGDCWTWKAWTEDEELAPCLWGGCQLAGAGFSEAAQRHWSSGAGTTIHRNQWWCQRGCRGEDICCTMLTGTGSEQGEEHTFLFSQDSGWQRRRGLKSPRASIRKQSIKERVWGGEKIMIGTHFLNSSKHHSLHKDFLHFTAG